MKRWCSRLVGAGFVAAVALFDFSSANAKSPCEDLKASTPAGITITSATFVPATQSTLEVRSHVRTLSLPDLCRVEGLIGRYIRFATWMPPAKNWNGKFEMFGGGGADGFINYFSMAGAVKLGYATAATEAGHKYYEDYAPWLKDPERMRDFAYRGVHETALASKALIARFYGKSAAKSYFCGCSNGGREGLLEAQQFPDDFDGVIAGAPAWDDTGLIMGNLWFLHAAYAGEAKEPLPWQYYSTRLDFGTLELVHNAAIEACDGLDGVKDGVIEDPTKCKFDPGVLLCKTSNTSNCLTSDQLLAVRQIYSGIPVTKDGRPRLPGMEPGSEEEWGMFTQMPVYEPYEVSIFRNVVFHDPNWVWQKFDYKTDPALLDQTFGQYVTLKDFDLSRFAARGGKIIGYIGWNDQEVPPKDLLLYYDQAGKATKSAALNSFFHVFMVPGMAHCYGGPGTDNFSFIEALDAWVTKGVAPERVVAAHVVNGQVTRTRPLCAYPKVAHWLGRGSTDKAENFTCG